MAYENEINQAYQKLGRAPTPEEMASDQANAEKYGIGGSLLSDIANRGGNAPGVGDRQQMVGGGGSTQVPTPSYNNDLIRQMMEQQGVQSAQNQSRGDNLYKLLGERASQSLAINRNDPIIRAQADAYGAQQERAGRNYLANLAEKAGPLANLQGEQRLVAEQQGQATGGFEAQLMGQELTARRNEIAQALAQQGSQLSADQANQLQRQLALLDNAIRQQQIGLGQKTLGQDWQRALLQNEQFLNNLGFEQNKYGNYNDLVRSGLVAG